MNLPNIGWMLILFAGVIDFVLGSVGGGLAVSFPLLLCPIYALARPQSQQSRSLRILVAILGIATLTAETLLYIFIVNIPTPYITAFAATWILFAAGLFLTGCKHQIQA